MSQNPYTPSTAEDPAPRPAAQAVPSPVTRRGLLSAAVGTAVAGGIAVGVTLTEPSAQAGIAQATTPQPAAKPSKIREYWIQADSFHHNAVPNGHDGMTGTDFSADQTTFWAIGYRACTPHWGAILPGDDDIGPNTGIPGPNIRAEVGDTIVIHFKNNDSFYRFPHSIHPRHRSAVRPDVHLHLASEAELGGHLALPRPLRTAGPHAVLPEETRRPIRERDGWTWPAATRSWRSAPSWA